MTDDRFEVAARAAGVSYEDFLGMLKVTGKSWPSEVDVDSVARRIIADPEVKSFGKDNPEHAFYWWEVAEMMRSVPEDYKEGCSFVMSKGLCLMFWEVLVSWNDGGGPMGKFKSVKPGFPAAVKKYSGDRYTMFDYPVHLREMVFGMSHGVNLIFGNLTEYEKGVKDAVYKLVV